MSAPRLLGAGKWAYAVLACVDCWVAPPLALFDCSVAYALHRLQAGWQT